MTIESGLRVSVVTKGDLPFIEKGLKPQNHEQRLMVQENGEGWYLVAWDGEDAVGHALVRWNGSKNIHLRGIKRPYIEAVGVRVDKQRKGVGKLIMEKAHEMLKERGFTSVGLAVGIRNEGARRLYESLGYRQDTDLGNFDMTWTYIREGKLGLEWERCDYFVKNLNEES